MEAHVTREAAPKHLIQAPLNGQISFNSDGSFTYTPNPGCTAFGEPELVAKPGQKPSAEEVKRFALANAPAYAHPRFVWFVDELPLASTNKLDRGTLRRLAAERAGSARG